MYPTFFSALSYSRWLCHQGINTITKATLDLHNSTASLLGMENSTDSFSLTMQDCRRRCSHPLSKFPITRGRKLVYPESPPMADWGMVVYLYVDWVSQRRITSIRPQVYLGEVLVGVALCLPLGSQKSSAGLEQQSEALEGEDPQVRLMLTYVKALCIGDLVYCFGSGFPIASKRRWSFRVRRSLASWHIWRIPNSTCEAKQRQVVWRTLAEPSFPWGCLRVKMSVARIESTLFKIETFPLFKILNYYFIFIYDFNIAKTSTILKERTALFKWQIFWVMYVSSKLLNIQEHAVSPVSSSDAMASTSCRCSARLPFATVSSRDHHQSFMSQNRDQGVGMFRVSSVREHPRKLRDVPTTATFSRNGIVPARERNKATSWTIIGQSAVIDARPPPMMTHA